MAPLLFKGFVCAQQSCDPDDWLIGCKSKSQLLCLTREFALAVGERPTGCGMVTDPQNDEYCKIGLYFCSFGLKPPDTLCTDAGQICCIKEAAALPFDKEYLDESVCSCYCLTCMPRFGCCVEAPRIPALEKSVFDYNRVPLEPMIDVMERGDVQMEPYSDHDDDPFDAKKAVEEFNDELL